MIFKKPELEDRACINRYLEKGTHKSCDFTFMNIYLWSAYYAIDFGIVENTLVFKRKGDNPSFTFPIGEKEDVKKALDVLMQWCEEEGNPYMMHLVTPHQFDKLEQWYPEMFQITYDRNIADYVYESEKLSSLSGRKYHSKKNHINKFQSLYPDWSYEEMGAHNLEECFQMALVWRNLNECEDDEDKHAEIGVTLNALRLFHELKLKGGVLRAEGKLVAFSIGEQLNEDCFVVHIEKAFADVPGAYPMMNQQFVLREGQVYTYINREEDMGEEGLRKSKLSYRPAFMIEKGQVRKKKG